MNLADFRSLFAYIEWANDQVLTTIAQLTDEQFNRVVGGSFPTLRETVSHLVVVEWVWLARWKGSGVNAPPAWTTADTLAPYREALRDVEADRAAFLAGLTDADLERPVSFTFLKGDRSDTFPLGELMQHVITHSAFHRGQLVSLIRQVGAVPPPSDLLDYLDVVRANR